MERWPVTKTRRTLFVIPLEGPGFPKLGKVVDEFAEFASLYFQMPVTEFFANLTFVDRNSFSSADC